MTWLEIWTEFVRYHIKYYNQISKVTKPLLDCFEIVCVDYLRTYKSGRFTYLSSRPECTEYYLSEQCYRYDPYLKHPDLYKTGFLWLENSRSINFQKFICNIGHKHNVYSPLMMIERGMDYIEMFCFSGKTDEAVRMLHLKHSQLLKTFATYYKKELGFLLHETGEAGFSLIDLQGESFYTDCPDPAIKTDSIHAFLRALGKTAEVERASSLSSRERDCLRLLLRGNSAKDTATELNLSQRTVEFYLENVKNKLNCGGKRELFSVASEFNNLGLL